LGFVLDYQVDIDEEELIFVGHLSEKEASHGVVLRDRVADDHIVRIKPCGIETALKLGVLKHIPVIKGDKGLRH
jgi:hypothetical protein